MKNAIVVASLLAFSSHVFAGAFCEGARTRSNAEQLAQLDPSFELEVLDLDLFPGGSIVGGYEYEVEPAYTNGLYSRIDRWQVGTKLTPFIEGSPSEETTWRFGAGAKYASEMTFIRFFDNACVAETAKPYSPRRVPLTAQRALGSKFNVGDYFLFKSSLGFIVNADILQLLGNPVWGMGANANYLVEGSYQIHIVRQDAKHVRMKMVARRGNETTFGLNLGWKMDFEVFNVSQLDRQLHRQLNPQPVKVLFQDTKAQVFLVDYILDLTDPAVADAFGKVLRKAGTIKNLQMANPFKNTERVEQGLLLDLSPLEDIYRADFNNGSVGRLKRNLRSSSQLDGRSLGIDLGNKLVGLEYDLTNSTSRMTLRAPDDSVERYLLKSFERTYDGQFALSWSRLFNKRSVEVLLKAKEHFKDLDAMNIIQTLERKDKRLSKEEFQEIRTNLRKALPVEIYATIPFESWGQGSKEVLKNFGMRFQLIMGPEVVLATPTLAAEDVTKTYESYIRGKGFGARDFYSDQFAPGRSGAIITKEVQYAKALKDIGSKLALITDKQRPDLERLEAFVDLRKNTLFSQTGIGFLLNMRKQVYRMDLNLSANGHQLDHALGDESIAVFYRQLTTIKAALENSSLDLRREAESYRP